MSAIEFYNIYKHKISKENINYLNSKQRKENNK